MANKSRRRRNKEHNRRNGESESLANKRAYVNRCRKRANKRLRGYPRKAQSELDLHYCDRHEAMTRVASFIHQSIDKCLKSVRIITGRGSNSKNGKAILREATKDQLEELMKMREVCGYLLEESSKYGSYIVYLGRHKNNIPV